MSLYAQRGVSAQKEEVHAAIKNWMQDCMLMRFAKCIQIIWLVMRIM
jgi:hypothetical protein